MYLQQSMSEARKRNLTRVIAFNYWGLGALKKIDKKYSEALDHYFEAEKLWTAQGETRSMVQTYQEIADIYRLQGNYAEAEKYLGKAMKMSKQIHVADLQVTNYLRFSRLDSLRGNYQRSLYYLSLHNALKDSVYNLLKAEQIARLQTIYETETREEENQQLRLDTELKNSEIKTQRLTLIAISLGLVLAAAFGWFINRQRKKIGLQRDAIEMQAVALLKLNEELQDLNKTLEARIHERTSQLTIQNQRLTEYTFINAHKLRAPVASILGLINLMQQVPDAEKEAIMQHLKTCGEQLDSIIREVSRNLEGAIVSDKP
jgi:tetratricopeptide (TPR) repeat protein